MPVSEGRPVEIGGGGGGNQISQGPDGGRGTIGVRIETPPAEMDDFITVVKIPRQTNKPQRYSVEIRRYDTRQADGEFTVTQCSEPLGRIEAQRLALVWGEFHRLEIR